MAATLETQRLISVSLGKIAQSRGQRGGINLHKNLLVATVLHKARTAYMMESYNYQQLQRQKMQQEQMMQQQQAVTVAAPIHSAPTHTTPVSYVSECTAPRDSKVGQPEATPSLSEETRPGSDTVNGPECTIAEPMVEHENQAEDNSMVHDKENSPPSTDCRLAASSENVDKCAVPDHLKSANQLSQEAQLATSENGSAKQQNLTSASATCNILKRRRDNPSACAPDNECPVNKKARVSYESTACVSYHELLSDFSDVSSDESDSEPEEMMHTSDSPQITNLVSIFNSGFSGLCAVSKDSDVVAEPEYQSDLDISNSPQYSALPLSKSRPESPSFSRKLPEQSLMCSSQVGRMDSMPSAIVLSA